MFGANGKVAILTAVAGVALAVPAQGQRYTIGGSDVAIYNLVGEIEVAGARGGDVSVQVSRGGSDGEDLDVQVGEVDGRQTLRVIYPADRISYGADRWNGSTTMRVRGDGTWGGDGSGWRGRGDRVRISSRGSGMEAHADLQVAVPAGKSVSIYLGVGRIVAENVDGEIRLDTRAGAVEARRMAGSLLIDTGSGSVVVDGMEGRLDVDTGSGGVRLAAVRGSEIRIDTGSGGVQADGLVGRRIDIDTGSGSITLRDSSAPNVRLDTGSGSVTAELGEDIDDLNIDTGSGSVTVTLPEDLGARFEIETGSGGIDIGFPIMVSRRSRGELRGEVGDGRGTIRIDTGSGGVRIRHP